jgi:hypothetical protein
MRALALLMLLAACSEDNPGGPDMARLQKGDTCYNLSGSRGICADGLLCCTVPCNRSDGGCVDLPSECEPDPPPAGYHDCM